MKSILMLWSVLGTHSESSDCQADDNSLLQAHSMVRKHKQVGANAVVQNLREVANSLLEGSDSTMTRDEVTDALAAASEALAELPPAILQQVENAQQQINDAAGAVQACHAQELADVRASLQGSAEERAVAAEDCRRTLEELQVAETTQCAIAEDCLCDEARVRTTDQEALCTSMTETYEAVFCEHHHVCTVFGHCHAAEVEVFERLRADIEAEMALVVQEYIAVEQADCLTALITQAMTPPITPISHAALLACDDVDVSPLDINYPALPSEPDACPAHTHGEPACVRGFTIDGCVRSDEEDHHPLTRLRSGEGTADVRCCSVDGSTCESMNLPTGVDFPTPNGGIHHGCVFGVSYQEAENVCHEAGMRLCNSDEMRRTCCSSGCWHNVHAVWVNLPGHTLVHDGHCAAAWMGQTAPNTFQANRGDCEAHCRKTDGCGFFAFCENGPDGCDGDTTCSLYAESGGCPDDGHWGAYNAYALN